MEVNFIDVAFVNGVHNVGKDTGHAFFYITESNSIRTFFSFGPVGTAIPGKMTNEYTGARQGTTSYGITEMSTFFRFQITKDQVDEIIQIADLFTIDVNNGKEKYDISLNDTCAESARDILSDSGIDTPDGSGPVTGTGSAFIDWVTEMGSFVNPYEWHRNFLLQYPTPAPIIYIGTGGASSLGLHNGRRIRLPKALELQSGDDDPLLLTNQHQIIHGDWRT
ncbi:hypothetical protein CKH23_17545 [Salmonella enterica]|nr:hypothetical protein [Salmonella enterica]